MLVNVTINRESSGKIKICVTRPRPWDWKRFKEFDYSEAVGVLLAFGFSDATIDEQIGKIRDYGLRERIDLGAKDVPDDILEAEGLRP